MKRRAFFFVAPIICGAWSVAIPVFAVDGTWNTDANNASWATATNWVSNTIANGTDATANFTFNITGDRTVLVDNGRTVGHLNFSDPAGNSNYILAGNDMTLDVTNGGNATITVNNAGQRITMQNRLQTVAGANSDRMEKKGPGTLFLNREAGKSEKWLVSEGTLEIRDSGDRLGTNPGSFTADAVILNGGTLYNSNNVSFGNHGNQGFTMGASGGTFRVNTGSTLTMATTSELIRGVGGLTKTGTGIMVIQSPNALNVNTYAGDTLVSEGELRLASVSNILPNGAGKGNVTVSTGAALNMNDRSDTINGLNGGGTVRSTSGTQTLTLGDGNANGSFSGALQNTAGTLNLAKIGSGTQTMAAGSTLTYGGTTTVSGTLSVDGTKSGAGTVTVNSDGTLSGSGSISGAITVNSGGTLSPAGAIIESLDVAVLSFQNSGANFTYQIDSSASLVAAADLVNGTGSLSLAGATLNISDIAGASMVLPSGTKFTLIRYQGAWNGATFNSYVDGGLVAVGANQFVIDYNDTTGGVNFGGGTSSGTYLTITSITAVPEASTVFFGCVVCGLLGMVHVSRKFFRSRVVT
jgi:autotransporter-associated beta strand protein